MDSSGTAVNLGNSLDLFFDLVRTQNPFLVNRVDRPWSEDLIDVFGIHEAEYRKILNLGKQAHQEQLGIGVALWGEAGVGKTHLLARLGWWARERQQAQFVYLQNFQADPNQVPRSLLRSILGVLSNGRMPPYYRSPLFALINNALRETLKARGLQRNNWSQLQQAFQEFIQQVAARDRSRGVLFNRTIYEVLFRYYQAAYPAQQGRGDFIADLALRWLAGESLSTSEQECLGLRELETDDRTGFFEKQHARQVIVALTELAHQANQFLLLCLDQFDNSEEKQVKALASFLHDLLDSAGNLLVLTTGVQETLQGFLKEGIIAETTWNRVGQVEIPLGRISKARGRELLWARLQRFLETARGPSEVEKMIARDSLFPLDTRWFEERLQQLTEVRPRDLLGWAAQRWQQHQEVLTTTPGPIWLARMQAETMSPNILTEDQKATVLDRQDTKVAAPQANASASPPPTGSRPATQPR